MDIEGMISRTALQLEVVNRMDVLESLKEDWNALLENNGTKTVELTYEWQMTYWRNFNENAELFVLIVREADSVVAIAPLKIIYLKVLGIKVRRLEIIAAAESNYQDLVIGINSEGVLKCIFNFLLSIQESWDILRLRHIPENSTTSHYLINRLDNYPFRRIVGIERCLFLKTKKTWAEHAKELGKSRSKKMAYRIRRLERDLGEIRLVHCSTEEKFRSRLLEFFDWHRRRWNKTDTFSQFNDDRYSRFYLDVVPELLHKRQIRLTALEAGGTPLAQLFSFSFGNVSLIQLIAYDIDYSLYSPMIVLYELFVEDSLSKGIKVIDFGSHDIYKELWANHLKNRMNFEIYPRRLLPYCIYFLTIIYELLRTSLKRFPHVISCTRYLRKKVRLLFSASR
jgi:CelD/BcsL family acetyltransferase involved in cellulose biosynthesis